MTPTDQVDENGLFDIVAIIGLFDKAYGIKTNLMYISIALLGSITVQRTFTLILSKN